MTELVTRDDLLRLKKKQILKLLGCVNMKDYYRQSGDFGKVSKKQLIKIYLS